MSVDTRALGEVTWRPQKHPSQPHTPPKFLVPVDQNAYYAWRKDRTSVPFHDVVDSFEIFINRSGGHTGQLDRPSKLQLRDAFGTDDPQAAIEAVLEQGVLKPMAHGNEIMPRDRRSYLFLRT